MPQFDLGTFIIEITWFFILFSVFYLVVLYYILPQLGVVLKLRARRINKLNFLKNENKISIFKTIRHMLKKSSYFFI